MSGEQFIDYTVKISRVAIYINLILLTLLPIYKLTTITLLILLCAIALDTYRNKRRISFTDYLLITLILVPSIVSCLLSIDKSTSFSYLEKLTIKPLILFISIRRFIQDRKEIENAMLFLCLGFLIFGTLNLLYGDYLPGGRFKGITPNSTILGKILDLAIPIALSCTITNRRRISLFLFNAITVLELLVCLIMSMTRASWIVVFISIVAIVILFIYKTNKSNINLTVTLVILIISVIIGLNLLPSRSRILLKTRFKNLLNMSYILTKDPSIKHRVDIYKTALYLIKQKPAFGWGFGRKIIKAINTKLGTEWFKEKKLTIIRWHTHNTALQILLEMGLFGFICYTIALVIFYKYTLTRIPDHQEFVFYSIGLILGISCVIIHGMVTNFIQLPIVYMLSAYSALALNIADSEIQRSGS